MDVLSQNELRGPEAPKQEPLSLENESVSHLLHSWLALASLDQKVYYYFYYYLLFLNEKIAVVSNIFLVMVWQAPHSW